MTIKFKRGAWEVEITASEEKVKQAVESVLAGMASKELAAVLEEPQLQGEGEKRSETCRGLLLKFWKEGWFATPRLLKDVDAEMAKRGYHYNRTAISHALVDLAREDMLSRGGAPRNYTYVQKVPPPRSQKSAAATA